jgi:putative heme-binding domain-containing protein
MHTRRLIRVLALTCPLALGLPAGRLAAQSVHEGQYAQADIIKGQGLYRAQCSTCHGTTGDAVGGVDLRRGRFRNARSDEDLSRLISTGIPGTAMLASKLEPAELSAIIAFIRAGFDVSASAIRIGNVARGQALFAGKGTCATCHRVGPSGPRSAPDLSDIGVTRNAVTLQGVLVDPGAYLLPANRPVRAVTRDGKVIQGRRLNEDTYTVQILDEKEQLVSLVKADLREYQVLKTPRMPSFRDKLSGDEIADVVAYLLSLRGQS